MSVNMIQVISVTAFVLAGGFAVAALVLWVTLDVRGIIDGLNGRAAERQIREWREQNTQSQLTVSLPKHEKKAKGQKEEETVLLREEVTSVLKEEEEAVHNAYRLVLNEIVVHTKEEIRIG